MKSDVKLTINEKEDTILQDGQPLICWCNSQNPNHVCSPRCPMNEYSKIGIQFRCGWQPVSREIEVVINN